MCLPAGHWTVLDRVELNPPSLFVCFTPRGNFGSIIKFTLLLLSIKNTFQSQSVFKESTQVGDYGTLRICYFDQVWTATRIIFRAKYFFRFHFSNPSESVLNAIPLSRWPNTLKSTCFSMMERNPILATSVASQPPTLIIWNNTWWFIVERSLFLKMIETSCLAAAFFAFLLSLLFNYFCLFVMLGMFFFKFILLIATNCRIRRG